MKTFILLFSILYTIDKKPINIIIDFIGIIISLAIFLIKFEIIDISFLSYIIIIIYASALAIIFGIIVMLYNTEKLVKSKTLFSEQNLFFFPFKLLYIPSSFSSYFSFFKLFFASLLFLFFSFLFYKINLFFLFNSSLFSLESYYLFISSNTDILFLIFNYLFNNPFFFFYIILIINILLFALIGIIYITI